jgi:lipopolysaccharide/colanic/teichoic acid biosynthesis glycosyltransferase
MSHQRTMTSVRHDARPAEADHEAHSRAEPGRGASGYIYVKTVVEWMAALILLVVLFPLLALLVKLTSEGPVFYQQSRQGRFGGPFQIHKFRTMSHRCEAATGPVWSVGDDPRVTRLGRWLRDTHLDELPQLWNVLRGNMSLIGPRPERPDIAAKIERAIPEFRERLLVRPGMTGLAQMRVPPDSDLHTVRRKLAHDRYYILHMGPGLDALIVVSTALHVTGMAATMASRRLVKSFPLPQAAKAPSEGAPPDLFVVSAQFGPHTVAPRDESTWTDWAARYPVVTSDRPSDAVKPEVLVPRAA